MQLMGNPDEVFSKIAKKKSKKGVFT